ncbi:hypothetical protein GCM10023068_08080 [Leifsonia shinshuensis]
MECVTIVDTPVMAGQDPDGLTVETLPSGRNYLDDLETSRDCCPATKQPIVTAIHRATVDSAIAPGVLFHVE